MRSIILGICATFIGATAPAAPTWLGTRTAADHCPDNPTAHLARPGKQAEFRRLTDLPPADAYRAVLRSDANGCVVYVKLDRAPRRGLAPPRRR